MCQHWVDRLQWSIKNDAVFSTIIRVSWWILLLLVPMETGINALQLTYLVVLNQLMTSWKFEWNVQNLKIKFGLKTCGNAKKNLLADCYRNFLTKRIFWTLLIKICSLISRTDSFFCEVMKYEILSRQTSKCAVYVGSVLTRSVETQLGVKL